MGDELKLRVAQVALTAGLLALAVNAVLIQTVMTDGALVKNAVRAGVLVLALIGLAANWRTVARWPAIPILLSGVLVVVRSNQDQLSIIFVVLLAALAAQVSERLFFGVAALSSVVAFVLIFGLVAVGLSTDEVVTVDFDQVVRARHNFGAQSIPLLFNVAFGACALSVLWAKKYLAARWLAAVTLVAFAAATFIYWQSDTRGGYATFLAFLILLTVVPRVRFGWGYALAPVILTGVTLWLSYGQVGDQINRTLSQRPYYLRLFVDELHWSDVLLSRSVKQFPYPVDSSFWHLAVGCSIFVLVGFLWLYARAVLRLMAEQRYPEVALLTATTLYCFTEGLLVRIENGFIVVAWYLVLHYGLGLVRQRHADDGGAGGPRGDRTRGGDAASEGRDLSNHP